MKQEAHKLENKFDDQQSSNVCEDMLGRYYSDKWMENRRKLRKRNPLL